VAAGIGDSQSTALKGAAYMLCICFFLFSFLKGKERKKSKKETKFVMPRQEREKEPRWMCV
jgi:hypothetical protein